MLLLSLPLALFQSCVDGGPGSGAGSPPEGSGADSSDAVAPDAGAPEAGSQEAGAADEQDTNRLEDTNAMSTTAKATFGAGCFWCVEAVLEQLDGVEDVVSGYMGGGERKPTYKEVCTGRTDYVEVVQVTFDPSIIGYDELLAWFWQLHDPTTLNRQGNDVGPQYRSVIFTHDDGQREVAVASMEEAGKSGQFLRPIVTAIEPADVFHEAEDYHQDYYANNKAQGYCQVVIKPKLKKLELDH